MAASNLLLGFAAGLGLYYSCKRDYAPRSICVLCTMFYRQTKDTLIPPQTVALKAQDIWPNDQHYQMLPPDDLKLFDEE